VSRTHHHGKWGRQSRDRRACKSHHRIFWAGSRRVGEAPGWHVFGQVCDGEDLSVNGADAVQVICESLWSRICHVAGKPEFVEVDEVGEPVTDETRAAM
jgi:hypothetical protein